MTSERTLPERRNPIFDPEQTPDHAELISRRRLGQTTLKAKPGFVGVSNATKPENLGVFEYAHLRVPLPDNLKGTEMFTHPYPDAYFLMRRSSNGHVSATGMFKAAFPWAASDEEQAERGYIRGLSTTAPDEVAGNVWITESAALKLAEDYGILSWIVALLDPSSIQADEKKTISSPPMYKFKANEKTFLPPTLATPARNRRARAGSPSKKDKPASPRKPRVTKAAKEANAANARQASENLQATLDAASVAESETPELPSINGEKSPSPAAKKSSKSKVKDLKVEDPDESEKVTVNVQSTTEVDGDLETTQTTVSVKMPQGSPGLPLPEDTAEMIAKAKQMVEEARKLEGESSASNTKRKADVFDDEEEDVENEVDGMEVQPSKKTKLMELEVKKQKVRNRALLGVAASLAIGALIPYVLGG